MDATMYRGADVVKVPGSKVKHYESLGFSTEKPAPRKKSKPPVTEEGSNDGEN